MSPVLFLRHAIGMLLHAPGRTVQILILPLLAMQLLTVTAQYLMLPSQERSLALALEYPLFNGLVTGVFDMALIVLYFVVTSWTAVAWHRYVLLGEQSSGSLPRWTGDRVWAYLWALLRISMVLLAIALAAFVLLDFFLGLLLPDSAEVVEEPTSQDDELSHWWLLLVFIFNYTAIRISLILPAIAIGKPMRIIESWRFTKDIGWTIAVAVSFIVALYWVSYWLMSQGTAAAMASYAFDVVILALDVSLLTTLYGVRVEGRDLNRAA